jgi:hypothetical protein
MSNKFLTIPYPWERFWLLKAEQWFTIGKEDRMYRCILRAYAGEDAV